MAPEIGNPFDEPRTPSKGEVEVENGSWLLMAFRWLKIPMPLKTDAVAVERVGALLTRRWPWLSKLKVPKP